MKGICNLAPFLLLLCVSFGIWVEGHLFSLSQQKLDTHIQLETQLISQHSDSSYVQRVMRLAKSAEIRSYMQPELDACDNFYDYSCGNWAKINPANDAKPRETNYQQLLANGFHHKQQKLLEQPGDVDIDDPAVLKLKQFYASCLHYRQFSTELYRQQLFETVFQFGRMPALELSPRQETTDFDWLATVAQIKRKYGLDILLRLQEAPDPHNKTQKRLFVGQSAQLIMKDNPRTAERRISYQLKQHLGIRHELAEITAREIVDLDMLLAKGMASRPLGVFDQPRSISELSTAYAPAFNLTRYIEMSLHRPLQSNEVVYEHVPSYLAHLMDILPKTPSHVVANYIFHKLLQSFYYDHTSASVVPQCLKRSRQLFSDLLNQMAYRHYGDAASLSDIDSVWQQIKRSFGDLIESSSMDWIPVATRSRLLQQLNATRLQINGHPHVNFTEIYLELELKPQDFLYNLRAVLSYIQLHPLALSSVSSSVPHYDAVDQIVILPVYLMQPNILWSRYYPRALRYGSLGAILAQQLSHCFDNRSDWDAASLTEFGKRKSCFKHQYERLRYGGEYLPATELQDDNIADNTALHVAFHAYMNYLANLATSALATEKLPQLELSPKQLFFISYAQLWCNDANEQFRDKHSLIATSTPNTLRIQGALSNLKAFASTFGCTSKDNMNPSQKCHMYANEFN